VRQLTWTVGAGGLLGSAVRRALAVELVGAQESAGQGREIPWRDPERSRLVLDQAIEAFTAELAAGPDLWLVAWCAGSGVVGTSREALAGETDTLRWFLSRLGLALDRARSPIPGLFFLASSAGGVYAGTRGRPLTEESAPAPISPYGEAKLEQEALLGAWAEKRPPISTLVARIANLYGPGQDLTKNQGLISLLARTMIRHQPVHIYVPMDTLRDYVYAEDGGRLVARCLTRLGESALAGEHRRVVKIVASERTTSIAELLSVLGRLARHHPRLVQAPERSRRSLQPAALDFCSTVWPDLNLRGATPLIVGMHRLYSDYLARYQVGELCALGAT